MMKSLLIKVTEGILLDKRRSRNVRPRAGTPGPGYESRGESTAADSDGYTRGAQNSDKDHRTNETSSEASPPTISASTPLDTSTANPDPKVWEQLQQWRLPAVGVASPSPFACHRCY